MKSNAMIRLMKAANILKKKNPDEAWCLLEMANHLRLLMRKEITIDQWNELYVGADKEPIDIDKFLGE